MGRRNGSLGREPCYSSGTSFWLCSSPPPPAPNPFPAIYTDFLNASPVWFSHPPTLCFCPVHSLNCPSVQTFLLHFILRAFQKPISSQEPPWIKGKYSYFPPIFPPIHPYLAQNPPAHGAGHHARVSLFCSWVLSSGVFLIYFVVCVSSASIRLSSAL